MHTRATVLAALLLAGAPAAHAAEITLSLGDQPLRDPTSTLLTDDEALTTLGLAGRHALAMPGLSAGAGLQIGGTADERYSPEGAAVDTRLRLTTVDLSVRYSRTLGRFTPWVEVGALGTVGALRLEDAVTGWTMPDPADPTGQTSLYEARPERDVGFAGGARATAGLAVRLSRGDGPIAALPARGVCEGEIEDGAPPAVEAPTATAPVDATPAAPPPIAATAPTDTAPEPSTAPTAARRTWGVYLEGGYALQTDLRFVDAGGLGLGGGLIRGGVFFEL